MKSILYAIVHSRRAAEAELPPGLKGGELDAVSYRGLAALLSPLSDRAAESAGVDQALEYARVVEDLHDRLTIVPMRYGCFVQKPEQAVEFLRRHEREFLEALEDIEGCDEMGVRLLLPRSETDASLPDAEGLDVSAETPGASYLSARRRYYDSREHVEQACGEWAERARAAFGGLFRHSSWEYVVRPEGTLLSLSFLVERAKVPLFEDAFQSFQRAHSVGAICSGPWPPYVFVAGLAMPDAAALAEMQFSPR